MSAEKQRWPRAAALPVAREICARLKPVCGRLIVAGSLRRRKETVGDVEIVFIPAFAREPFDLFADKLVDMAAREIEGMLAAGIIAKRLNRSGHATWGDKNKLAVHVASGIPVDFFATTEASWFNYLVCRTGPAALNTEIATRAQAKGWQWNPYGSGFTELDGGAQQVCGSEQAVFEFVGLPYCEPWGRE
jgi:DNA polymerase/3'-5' exonuclease PolX